MLALLAFATLLLLGCASSHFYVDQEWKGQPKPASVKVVFTKPVIGNPDDLKDDLPEYESNFVKWFGPVAKFFFIEESRKTVKFSMKQVSDDAITMKKVKLGNDDFDAPSFAEMKGESTVHLVISSIWLGRESYTEAVAPGNASFMAGAPMGPTYQTTRLFVSKCKYAFYDTKSGKLLGYGYAKGKSVYQFAVTKSDWEFALRDMVNRVLANTPIVSW